MVSNKTLRHIPVLANEIIEALRVKKGEKYIDATVGDAGHALEIVKKGGKLLAIDQDPESVKRASETLEKAYPVLYRGVQDSFSSQTKSIKTYPCVVVLGNFKNLREIAKKYGFLEAAGIIFDLGVSSYQLENKKKGLSFNIDSPLDMRLDPTLKVTASEIINKYSQKKLYEIFARNAQEELAWPISQAIISTRRLKPIQTTKELAQIVEKTRSKRKPSKLHPATKIFLALRIEVNQEIYNLKAGIDEALRVLKTGGRIAVISFHETEDRIIKQKFKTSQKEGELTVLTKKPITPSKEEITNNPRSRSAKLRIALKR